MADPSKTEKATPKRREKQRGEGNVPKSQELPKAMSIFAGMLALFVYSDVMFNRFKIIFAYFLENMVNIELTENEVYRIIFMFVTELAIIVLPFLIFLAFVMYMTLRLQVGPLWTTQVFKIKWENFNIIKGLQRILVSPETLVRLLRSVFLILIISIVPYYILTSEYPKFIDLYYTNAEGLGTYMVTTAFKLVLYTLAPMFVIGFVDLWHTRYKYEENIKMSKQEVKDEAKQAEMDPQIKQKQKQFMMKLLLNNMFKNVPRADVVITNPTHFAVALMYDPTISPAPIVVAKGADNTALKIREIANEHKIPIRENKALAQALYKQVEIGDVIPEDLFKAVAAILAQIWKMKGKKV